MRLSALIAILLLLSACPGPGPAGEGDACLTCHEGIEQAHASIEPGDCVSCHGGDREAVEKEAAHVAVPPNWEAIRGTGLPPAPYGFIKDFAPDQLDALDPAYVRFINPGDIRVLDATCGTCHPDQVATMPTSVMTTNAGHYYPTLLLAGQQEDRLAHYGSFGAIDPDCDPVAFPGSVCEVEQLRPPTAAELEDAFADGVPDEDELLSLTYRHYLSKNCNTCHQAGYPRNNSPGLYRSSGCSACHMVYDTAGTYQGDDPTIPRGTPTHAREHRITSAIPTTQCATCHFQGGRIGLLFQGIREGGFGSNTPPNAAPIQETLYGHAPGYYFTDEDTTNSVDETPPDVHYAAGMHCVDCHVGSDVHGDGRIWSTSKQQVDIRCEDCHGTVREAVLPDDEGVYRTASGRALPQLRQRSTGEVVLVGRVDGLEHVVPQPADLLAPGGLGSDGMHAAMGEDQDGWSHTDSLTCDTCHTSYNLFCIGCHVSLDLRLSQVDYQTGTSTPGLTRGSRSTYSLDDVLLGTAPDGRIQSTQPSQQVQISVIGSERFGTADGELLHGGRVNDRVVGKFRHSFGFEYNNGFAPMFQHTTTDRPRGCDTCHRRDESPEELARVRGVYGYGTGEFMLPAHDGSMVDGLQFLDAEGNAITTWVHEGTGPVAPEARTRALDVILGD